MKSRKTGRARRPKFAGLLAQPIKLQRVADLSSSVWETLFPDDREAVHTYRRAKSENVAQLLEATLKKLPLLAQHLGIKTEDFDARNLLLVLHLCRAYVPGFRVKYVDSKKKGRRKNRASKWRLILDVERIKVRDQCTDIEALKTLLRTDRLYWSGVRAPTIDPSGDRRLNSLKTKLYEARRSEPTWQSSVQGFKNSPEILQLLSETIQSARAK